MRTAILSDIHANREAFDAVIAVVRDLGVDRIVLLGDLVGYGPDPVHIVEQAAALVEDGAVCIKGNHDEAAVIGAKGFSEDARDAIEWTRKQLGQDHVGFLDRLPLSWSDEDRLFVHASACEPGRWHYIDGVRSAAQCLDASDARAIFCGHTHVPALFYALPERPPACFTPIANRPAPLSALRRHVIVIGSVGQPRDGLPAACFGLLDTDERAVTMVRVPYDAAETARKIAARSLPRWLGMRLLIGR
jgi:diadenosine tetraphosphatase ApaH/serine/threonine PP2A family protein phosphatase